LNREPTMASKTLFSSTRGALLPAANTHNREGAPAYEYEPKHQLAQYATTGCLSNTFYAGGSAQLNTVLKLASELEPEFIAKCAVYAREEGAMKDMPALLLAVLSMKSTAHLRQVFPRVIDNGRMLRTFVQILRSGAVGRKSLGTAPKALVRAWLDAASERALVEAAVGNDPSLKDVVKMVHPKPADATREATNAARLAAIGGGGTNCSAPLRWLADRRQRPDLVILVSDNQSWVDARANGATETMRQWARVKACNASAKLVCIDLQPNGSTQVVERGDVLNVGGFSDDVFEVVTRFVRGELGPATWVAKIEQKEI
jgi:hypothetical protein